MIGIQQLCTSTYMKVAFPDKAEVDFTRAAGKTECEAIVDSEGTKT